jgi:probable O-glycosylation ligase (exosortase A-associated)
MQSLFLSAVFFSLIFMGFTAAFATALGFIWVDIVKPQKLAYAIITGWPLSMITAVILMLQYTIKDKKFMPRFSGLLWMVLLFSIWITLTAFMSPLGERPWLKWDWAFKVLIFTLLIPYVFRSRVQIEAFLLVMVFSAATIFSSAGVKTLLGSGGYGVLAIMGSGNSGLAEGSTLSVVCVMLIPLIVYLMRNTIVVPRNLFMYCVFAGMIVTALATVVGTSARTGIIAVAVMSAIFFMKSRKKFWWVAGVGIAAAVLTNIDLSATPWGSRMSTIETYDQDSSALGRIKVWEWTISYVNSHPLGGGFDSFILNRIASVSGDGVIQYYPDEIRGGKAFHSIYFEVLGEQGYPGFLLYLAMIVSSLLKLRSLKKKWRDAPGMSWMANLADAVVTSIVIFLAGGAFVGIAYQPFIFYLIGLTVTLDQYSARLEKTERMPKKTMVTT